jgi:hypothetical protein
MPANFLEPSNLPATRHASGTTWTFMHTNTIGLRSLLPLLGASLLACTNSPEAQGEDETETSVTGDPGDGDPGDGDPGDGDPGDGDPGDGDPGDGDGDGDGDDPGDGDDDPVPDYPQPGPCEPIDLVVSDTIPLTYTYTYTVGDVDGQPGDEIVAYHQGEILSISDGVPTASPHPLPFGGVTDAVLLRANEDEQGQLRRRRLPLYLSRRWHRGVRVPRDSDLPERSAVLDGCCRDSYE